MKCSGEGNSWSSGQAPWLLQSHSELETVRCSKQLFETQKETVREFLIQLETVKTVRERQLGTYRGGWRQLKTVGYSSRQLRELETVEIS